MKCPECDNANIPDGKFGKLTCNECLTVIMVTADTIKVREHQRYYESPVMRSKGVRVNKGKPIPQVVTNGDITFELMKCMKCEHDLHVSVGSIRARMLHSYREMITEGNVVDPTTMRGVRISRTYPKFVTGRLCLKCQAIMRPTDTHVNHEGKLTANPRKTDEYEILQERITARQHNSITKGIIKIEDEASERVDEEEKKVYIRPVKHLGVRVQLSEPYIPPVVEKDADGNIMILDENEINLKAFGKFGGGSRGGMKDYDARIVNRFDADINFKNIKKGGK